ncbi:MAG: polyprenyl synthetase family protein, partial [Chloroflexota bacterium]|nr:polyprenyl synthetase family protein [Chloroflexota bacterium]
WSSAFQCNQTRESYFQRIGSKTASLFAASTESGALLSGAPDAAVRALREYGHALGMAFQIADDILDFLGDDGEMGKPTGSDLLEGTLTLPAVLLLEKEPGDNVIRQAFEGDGGKRALKRAIQNIRRSPYIDESYRIAKEFCTRAGQALMPLPDSPSQRSLASLAEYVVSRRR